MGMNELSFFVARQSVFCYKSTVMIKTLHVFLRINKSQSELLKTYQAEVARCWNDIVRIAREYYYENDHKWISKNALQKLLKGKYNLHSQTIQALTDKFAANRQTTAQLRKQGLNNIKYPYREKKYLTIPFKQSAIRINKDGELVLTLKNRVWFNTHYKPELPVHTAEIIYKNGRYILAVTMEFPEKPLRISGLRAGIDIGEIHPIAICAENGDGLVISGRLIRSIKQWRNKSLAKLNRAISRCKKGSRQWKRYVRAKGKLISKTENQIKDLLHKATRKAIDWATAKGICEIVIGNPVGVEKNTRKNRRLSHKSAQKVSQMEYGRIKKYLEYKAKEQRIKTCLKNERGTSKECPVCGCKNHCNGRVYKCSCGFVGHRDGKAGFMILRKKYPDIPTPEFNLGHIQVFSKYRKRSNPACVEADDSRRSSSVIAVSLGSLSKAV